MSRASRSPSSSRAVVTPMVAHPPGRDPHLEDLCRARQLPEAWIPRLVHYLRQLERWNQVHNLTAVREPAAMLDRHVLDSLTLLPWLSGGSVLDVGTGAGIPGIVLALADPDRRYLLIDASLKRIRFVRMMLMELGLTNAQAQHVRVQDLPVPPAFATVVSRAFAAPADMVAQVGHCVAENGRILVMLGARGLLPRDQHLPDDWEYVRIAACPVAMGTLGDASRYIAEVRRRPVQDGAFQSCVPAETQLERMPP
jgi:16S rRNA (guanine527-N7)-methyltransferase